MGEGGIGSTSVAAAVPKVRTCRHVPVRHPRPARMLLKDTGSETAAVDLFHDKGLVEQQQQQQEEETTARQRGSSSEKDLVMRWSLQIDKGCIL